MKPLLLALLSSLLAVGFGLTATQGATFNEDVGLQLYSLRAQFTKNVPETVKKVRDFGFKKVELASTYNLSPEKFKQMLDENKLKAVSGHYPFDRYEKDAEGIAKEAKVFGLEYVGCAWIPHDGDFDEAECRKAVEVFNRAGETLAKHGIKFFYHCHGYEFRTHGSG